MNWIEQMINKLETSYKIIILKKTWYKIIHTTFYQAMCMEVVDKPDKRKSKYL